jgi:hypothetical protein
VNTQKNVEIFGDSLLKGVQLDPESKRYYVNNTIDAPPEHTELRKIRLYRYERASDDREAAQEQRTIL